MTEILDAKQLAAALQITPDQVGILRRKGRLPYHEIGGHFRYVLGEVLDATRVAEHPDDQAVAGFAVAMHAKMALSRAKGREGWEDCDIEHLADELVRHVAKGDPVDVANFAMMLHARAADPQVLAAAFARQKETRV